MPQSPDNTVFIGYVPGSASALYEITDTQGNRWSISTSQQVEVNGVVDPTTANVTAIAYINGLIWQENASGLWYSKSSSTGQWSAATATSPIPAGAVIPVVLYHGGVGTAFVVDYNNTDSPAGYVAEVVDDQGTGVIFNNTGSNRNEGMISDDEGVLTINISGQFSNSGSILTKQGIGASLVNINLAANSSLNAGGSIMANDVAGATATSLTVSGAMQATDISNLANIYVTSNGVLTVSHDLTNIASLDAEDGGVIAVGNDLVNVQNIAVGFGSSLEVDHNANGAAVVLGGIGSGTLDVGKEFSIFVSNNLAASASQALDGNGDSVVTINTPSPVSGSTGSLTIDVSSPTMKLINPTLVIGSTGEAVIPNATVSIGPDVNLSATIAMAGGTFKASAGSPSGSRLNFVGNSRFDGTSVDFEAPISGSGTIILGAELTSSGPVDASAVFGAGFAVGSGITVDLEGGGNHAAMGGASVTLTSSFGGTVQFLEGTANYIDVTGVTADSYSLNGNVLSLYSAGTVVYTLNVINNSGIGGGKNLPLTVERNASGILISDNDQNQAGGPGTMLPIHVAATPGPSSQYIVADDKGSLYELDKTTGIGRDLPGSQLTFQDGIGLFDPTGNAENVARLYQAGLDRAPDVAGLEAWTAEVDRSQVSLEAVASSFTTSPEFIKDYGSLTDAAFINQLYLNVLNRSADPAGLQAWENVLASGGTRGRVLLGFAESQENKANTVSTAGDVDNAEAYRLYQAALHRAPDTAGLNYWSGLLASGRTPIQIGQSFINSAEFQQDYGALSVSDFVTTLYENVLHRAPDAAGLQYWTNALQTGSSEASVLVGFSDSLENRVQTASATHANWVFIPS